MMKKIQANKCLAKITKDIVDAMHTSNVMTQRFTSEKISPKQIRDVQCIILFKKIKCCIISPT
jgi:hypothetical protein